MTRMTANTIAKVLMITVGSLLILTGSALAGCESGGRLGEIVLPEAVIGMSFEEPGFTAQFWEWGNAEEAHSGSAQVLLKPTDQGFGIAQADWADADVCREGNTTPRTVVLFESLGVEGGRYAVINLSDNDRNDVDIDATQDAMHGVRSAAAEVPRPSIVGIKTTSESYFVQLSWEYDPQAEALSDLVDAKGRLVSSITSFSLWVADGGAKGGQKDGWCRVGDSSRDAVSGFSTDTSALIKLPRESYEGSNVRFAVGLVLDGNGDARDRASGCVCSTYLSAASAGLKLTADPMQTFLREISLRGSADSVLSGEVAAVNEPEVATYVVYARRGWDLQPLTKFRATGHDPEAFSIEVPEWVLSDDSVIIRVELLTKAGPITWIEDSRISLAL